MVADTPPEAPSIGVCFSEREGVDSVAKSPNPPALKRAIRDIGFCYSIFLTQSMDALIFGKFNINAIQIEKINCRQISLHLGTVSGLIMRQPFSEYQKERRCTYCFLTLFQLRRRSCSTLDGVFKLESM